MADDVTLPGTGAVVATDDDGTRQYQWIKPAWGPDNTFNKVDIASGKPMPVQLRGSDGTDRSNLLPVSIASGGVASGAVASGAVASGAFASGALASGSVASGAIASGAIAVGAIAAGATSIAENEDVGSADGDRGVKILAVRKATPANTSGTDGDYEFFQISAGRLWTSSDVTYAGTAAATNSGANSAATPRVTVATDQNWATGMACKAFAVAFTTLTRPANTTAYTAADSISNNATAGSVTALTATVGDVNDDPLTLTHLLLHTTDTGFAGKRIRAVIYNSDPTASSGVGGGDNAAFSNKKAGYVGSMSGVMETGFSDGSVGRLVPAFNDTTTAPAQNAAAGGFIICKPSSAGKALWVQYQAMDATTPSANSTTFIGTIHGYQSRAG